MVQMKKWAAAEAAMEALNGTSPLEGSKERPLVVNFANPRRGTIAVPGEIAIAPRKLFIRQVNNIIEIRSNLFTWNLFRSFFLLSFLHFIQLISSLSLFFFLHRSLEIARMLTLQNCLVNLATLRM